MEVKGAEVISGSAHPGPAGRQVHLSSLWTEVERPGGRRLGSEAGRGNGGGAEVGFHVRRSKAFCRAHFKL